MFRVLGVYNFVSGIAVTGTTLSPSEEAANYEREKKDWLIWVQAACIILATLGLLAKLYTKCQESCKCCNEWQCLASCSGNEEAQIGPDLVILE